MWDEALEGQTSQQGSEVWVVTPSKESPAVSRFILTPTRSDGALEYGSVPLWIKQCFGFCVYMKHNLLLAAVYYVKRELPSEETAA